MRSCNYCCGSCRVSCDCTGEYNCPKCGGSEEHTCPACGGSGRQDD